MNFHLLPGIGLIKDCGGHFVQIQQLFSKQQHDVTFGKLKCSLYLN